MKNRKKIAALCILASYLISAKSVNAAEPSQGSLLKTILSSLPQELQGIVNDADTILGLAGVNLANVVNDAVGIFFPNTNQAIVPGEGGFLDPSSTKPILSERDGSVVNTINGAIGAQSVLGSDGQKNFRKLIKIATGTVDRTNTSLSQADNLVSESTQAITSAANSNQAAKSAGSRQNNDTLAQMQGLTEVMTNMSDQTQNLIDVTGKNAALNQVNAQISAQLVSQGIAEISIAKSNLDINATVAANAATTASGIAATYNDNDASIRRSIARTATLRGAALKVN
jgi:hypothetical protein